VLETRRLLESGEVKNVTEAARRNGISRSTYYKYKDSVFDQARMPVGLNAVFLLVLSHEAGVLSNVLAMFSRCGANILTISQNLPIQNTASVTLTVDISNVRSSTDDLICEAQKISGVVQIQLIAAG
jgi:chorismate mutase